VLSVALTPDGQWVLSGSKDRGVQFWDPTTGHAQLMLQGHKNSGKLAAIDITPSDVIDMPTLHVRLRQSKHHAPRAEDEHFPACSWLLCTIRTVPADIIASIHEKIY
jgi:glucose repression regulatory protein TUP1